MKLVFGIHYRKAEPEDKDDLEIYLNNSYQETVEAVADSVILTRQEFNELRAKIAGDAWDAAEEHTTESERNDQWHKMKSPGKQQYLSSLNTKENV